MLVNPGDVALRFESDGSIASYAGFEVCQPCLNPNFPHEATVAGSEGRVCMSTKGAADNADNANCASWCHTKPLYGIQHANAKCSAQEEYQGELATVSECAQVCISKSNCRWFAYGISPGSDNTPSTLNRCLTYNTGTECQLREDNYDLYMTTGASATWRNKAGHECGLSIEQQQCESALAPIEVKQGNCEVRAPPCMTSDGRLLCAALARAAALTRVRTVHVCRGAALAPNLSRP